MSEEPAYILYDERYLIEGREDDASVICCEDTMQAAKQAVEDQGFPCVIVGPGCESGMLWMPKAMRGD